MNNEQKLQEAFIEALGLPTGADVQQLVYNSIPEWDSIAHMALVAQLDDIIDISSFTKAKEVLSKYGVEFA